MILQSTNNHFCSRAGTKYHCLLLYNIIKVKLSHLLQLLNSFYLFRNKMLVNCHHNRTLTLLLFYNLPSDKVLYHQLANDKI
jgi:hypothetical protein